MIYTITLRSKETGQEISRDYLITEENLEHVSKKIEDMYYSLNNNEEI